MLIIVLMIGLLGTIGLAVLAFSGPSQSKALKRRREAIKERHGDLVTGKAEAQIRKLLAQRSGGSVDHDFPSRLSSKSVATNKPSAVNT